MLCWPRTFGGCLPAASLRMPLPPCPRYRAYLRPLPPPNIPAPHYLAAGYPAFAHGQLYRGTRAHWKTPTGTRRHRTIRFARGRFAFSLGGGLRATAFLGCHIFCYFFLCYCHNCYSCSVYLYSSLSSTFLRLLRWAGGRGRGDGTFGGRTQRDGLLCVCCGQTCGVTYGYL